MKLRSWIPVRMSYVSERSSSGGLRDEAQGPCGSIQLYGRLPIDYVMSHKRLARAPTQWAGFSDEYVEGELRGVENRLGAGFGTCELEKISAAAGNGRGVRALEELLCKIVLKILCVITRRRAGA